MENYRQLIEKAKQKDQDAISRLYELTKNNVYAYVRTILNDEDLTQDILQDSYLRAFAHLDQLKNPDNFKAWVRRIAHNNAVDYLRKHKKLKTTSMVSSDSDEVIDFEDTRIDHSPELLLDQAENERLLKEIIYTIPEDQRLAILMYFYENYSIREIADTCGVSENTIKSRINLGKKKIETKVNELEKKGVKLYGLAPIPLLLTLLKGQEAYAAVPGMSFAAAGAGAGASSVASAGTKAARTALRTKIIAGVAGAAVLGGAAAGAVLHNREEGNAKQEFIEAYQLHTESAFAYDEMICCVNKDIDDSILIFEDGSDGMFTSVGIIDEGEEYNMTLQDYGEHELVYVSPEIAAWKLGSGDYCVFSIEDDCFIESGIPDEIQDEDGYEYIRADDNEEGYESILKSLK